MKDGDLDPQETESTLLALTQVFHEESEDLAELCHMVGGFDDLKSAWERQNEALCGALHSELTFFNFLRQQKPLHLKALARTAADSSGATAPRGVDRSNDGKRHWSCAAGRGSGYRSADRPPTSGAGEPAPDSDGEHAPEIRPERR